MPSPASPRSGAGSTLGTDRDGRPVATPFPVQDSSMLATLARAEASLDHLKHRQPGDAHFRRPALRDAPERLAADLVRSLNAQAAGRSGPSR